VDDVSIAIIALVLFVVFIITLIYTTVIYFSASGSYQRALAKVDKIRHMEKIARLRHRDLEAFAKELNIIRAKKGKKGIPKATLARIQYNLMYSIDE
jgi:hypothetical protein